MISCLLFFVAFYAIARFVKVRLCSSSERRPCRLYPVCDLGITWWWRSSLLSSEMWRHEDWQRFRRFKRFWCLHRQEAEGLAVTVIWVAWWWMQQQNLCNVDKLLLDYILPYPRERVSLQCCILPVFSVSMHSVLPTIQRSHGYNYVYIRFSLACSTETSPSLSFVV